MISRGDSERIRGISLNCFLLTAPILVWNIVLANQLPKAFQPDIFWKDIPIYLTFPENISRYEIFMLMFLMPLSISSNTQKKGLFLYLVGTIIYFASWLVLIYLPEGGWSNNFMGFMAPAYTPLLWLIGIGMIGDSFYFKLPYRRWMFISASILFLIFHNLHAVTIYFRTH